MRHLLAFIRGLRPASALMLTAIALAACSAGPHTPVAGDTIDGFVLGSVESCSPPAGSIEPALDDRSCAGQQALAVATLDRRDPGHATVESVREFADGTQPGPIDVTGDAPLPPLPSRHAGPSVQVFVFSLADGSVRATGVACADSATCVGVGSYPPRPGSIVGGFPLGAPLNNAPEPDIAALGIKALDEGVPGHASIVSATAYHDDMSLIYRNDAARSGTMTVYVFALSDGTYRAAGVYCGPAGCQPWPVYRPS